LCISFIWENVDQIKEFHDSPSNAEADTQRLWDDLQIRIVQYSTRIWVAVKDVLCNDSPEGHLPQDLEEEDDIDTKDVLSYSFRAIHESR